MKFSNKTLKKGKSKLYIYNIKYSEPPVLTQGRDTEDTKVIQ